MTSLGENKKNYNIDVIFRQIKINKNFISSIKIIDFMTHEIIKLPEVMRDR